MTTLDGAYQAWVRSLGTKPQPTTRATFNAGYHAAHAEAVAEAAALADERTDGELAKAIRKLNGRLT
jgi:hypothetical protein